MNTRHGAADRTRTGTPGRNVILSFEPEREARGIWQYFTELEVT